MSVFAPGDALMTVGNQGVVTWAPEHDLVPIPDLAEEIGISVKAIVHRAEKRQFPMITDAVGRRCIHETDAAIIRLVRPKVSLDRQLAQQQAAFVLTEADRKGVASVDERIWLERLSVIGDAVHEVTGITLAEVVGKSREQHRNDARRIMVVTLRRLGLTVAHIGRLLNRDHSTILNALERSGDLDETYKVRYPGKQSAEVAREVAAAVEDVLTRLATTGLYVENAGKPDVPPMAVLDTALSRVEAPVRAQVRAFIDGALLGRSRRYHAPSAAYGLIVLSERPDIRSQIVSSLRRAGLSNYEHGIQYQSQRCGYRWVS